MKKSIWFLLLALIQGPSLPIHGANTVFFLVAELPGHQTSFNDSCVIPISRPEDIAQARKIIANPSSTSARIPMLVVTVGKDRVNRDYLAAGTPEWSWHTIEFAKFAENIILEFDATPSNVQQRYLTRSTSALVGFSSYTVVSERGPALCLTSQVNENGVTMSWPEISNDRAYVPIGTNFVYTLESTDSLSSTNWIPVAGGPWPAKTNQWTLSKASISNRFFRVRAQVAP